MTEKYIAIQNEVIKKYRIDLCDGTKCKDDWSRTHAHIKQRRVCKWIQKNSIESLFTLLHEIGHIEHNQGWILGRPMRRAEEEYYATKWALGVLREYGLTLPEKRLQDYRDYVQMEMDRGVRRGGTSYRINPADLR